MLIFALHHFILETENGVTKTEITSSSTNKDDGSTCKDMRVSKIYKDVTLNGGKFNNYRVCQWKILYGANNDEINYAVRKIINWTRVIPKILIYEISKYQKYCFGNFS